VLLQDPQFAPTRQDLILLQSQLRAIVLGSRQKPLSASESSRLSARIAEEATLALLEPLRRAGHSVVDANSIRRNQPGYDILDRRLGKGSGQSIPRRSSVSTLLFLAIRTAPTWTSMCSSWSTLVSPWTRMSVGSLNTACPRGTTWIFTFPPGRSSLTG